MGVCLEKKKRWANSIAMSDTCCLHDSCFSFFSACLAYVANCYKNGKSCLPSANTMVPGIFTFRII